MISETRLRELREGLAETRHLAEMLAVDLPRLLAVLGVNPHDVVALDLPSSGFVKRMEKSGSLLARIMAMGDIQMLRRHPSDTVRGLAAYADVAVAVASGQSLSALCDTMRGYAADAHFAVREWAWMALRPHMAQDPQNALNLFEPWVHDFNPYIRRFAIEVLRPRGVWTPHMPFFKRQPAMMLPLLEPLQAETHKYVQDSVANWLNDAGKDQPDFVRDVCARWRSRNPGNTATERICRRASRRLKRAPAQHLP